MFFALEFGNFHTFKYIVKADTNLCNLCVILKLKANLGLCWVDCQHAMINKFLCMVAGGAFGTDVCHWMFLKRLTWFKVNKIPL